MSPLDSTKLSLGLLKWRLRRNSEAELGELADEYLREKVGDELNKIADPSLSDQEFEVIALHLLRFGRLPNAQSLSLDEKLKQPWAGDTVHFEDSTFEDVEKERTSWDWVNTYFRLDNWVTGMTSGLLSIPRMLGLTCVLAVGSLPFVLQNDDNRVARAFRSGRFPEAYPSTTLTAKPSDATPSPAAVPQKPAMDAPPAEVETQMVKVVELPPAEFDEALLDLPIEMIERKAYDQALEQLRQLMPQASAAGKRFLPELIMVETLLRKADEPSRELAWKTLVEQSEEETKLHRHLLAARFLLDSNAGERKRILAGGPPTSTFGKRAYLWAQVQHGITAENRLQIDRSSEQSSDDFLNNLCDVLFAACTHYRSGEHVEADQKLKYVQVRLESLRATGNSEALRWLLESSRERLKLKIDSTIANLRALAKSSADAASS